MNVNLFVNFYEDSNKARQRELLICVLANIYIKEIDTVHILVEKKHLDGLFEFLAKVKEECQHKVDVIPFEGRPTYNDYFKFTEKYPKDLNIIANKDMIMDGESLQKLKNWDWTNRCIALSRWDIVDDNLVLEDAVLFDRADSQDTWIVKGAFPQIPTVDFGLGIAGCDNAIADRLSKFYEMVNPSLEIKTYHYHVTEVRNYLTVQKLPKEKVPQPYKLITPTMLP